MTSFQYLMRPKSFSLLTVVLLLVLTACASTSDVVNSDHSAVNSRINETSSAIYRTSPNETSNSISPTSIRTSKSPLTITIGRKQDKSSQVLTEMYALLLRHAGFKVVERPEVSTKDAVFNAIISGNIDLSPEPTATALKSLGLNSVGDAQLDYLQAKQGYEAKYHITWLYPAPINGEVYSLAPVVRDSILKKAPQIATALNRLAPILTTHISQQLQSEVVHGKSVSAVATQFLQNKGLL